MPLFTEAEKRKLLLGSVDSGAKTRTYTALLGFRQLSQSRLKTGSRKFTGLVGEFDIATRRLVHKLATEYKSCKELKETLTISPNFIHQDVEDRLSEFGSRIWNSRYPFVTITDNEKGDHKSYMRYLDYAEDDDRARIRTYVYCWILQRVSRNLRGKPKRSGGEQPNQSVHNSEDDSATILSPGSYTMPADVPEGPPGSSMSTNRMGSTHLGATSSYQTPVAKMVSDRTQLSMNFSRSTVSQLGPKEIHKEHAHRRISTRTRKQSERGEASGTSFRLLQSASGSRHARSLRRKGSSGGFRRSWPPSREGDDIGDNITVGTQWPLSTDGPIFHGLPMSTEEPGDSPVAGIFDAQTRRSTTIDSTHSRPVTDNDVAFVPDFAQELPATSLPTSPKQSVRKPTLVVKLKINHAQTCNVARSDTVGSSTRPNLQVVDYQNSLHRITQEEVLQDAPGPVLRKRKHSLCYESLDTGAMTLRKRGKQPVHDLEERESISPGLFYPSPRGSSHDGETFLNFPNVHPAGPEIRELHSTSVTRDLSPANEDASGGQVLSLSESNLEEDYDDRDSVIGSIDDAYVPQTDYRVQLRLTASDHRMTYASTMELQGSTEPDLDNHTRLRPELLEMLLACDPGNHDLNAMKRILGLIKKIWKDDKSRLKEVYGYNFDRFNTTRIHWLEGMEELLAIRGITRQGFSGDRKARDAYLETLPEDLNGDANLRLFKWRAKVIEWRGTRDSSVIRESSEDLASMFVELVDWESLSKSYLTRLVIAFNEKLWGWF